MDKTESMQTININSKIIGIREAITMLVKVGKEQVKRDMTTAHSIEEIDTDHTIGYPQKNKPFYIADAIGCNLLEKRLYEIAMFYFEEILEEVIKFEENTGKRLSKGLIYADLGIAQMASDFFEVGVANLYKGYLEDQILFEVKKWGNFDAKRLLLESPYYAQFEKDAIIMLESEGVILLEENVTLDQNTISTLLKTLSSEFVNRLFFVASVLGINRYSKMLEKNNNDYTRLMMLSQLQNLCLLIEDVLRHKGHQGKDLYNVLCSALKNNPIWPDIHKNWGLTSSDNDLKFFCNLKTIIGLPISSSVKTFLLVGCIRNFSAHHICMEDGYLFQNLKTIYRYILSTIFLLKALNQI